MTDHDPFEFARAIHAFVEQAAMGNPDWPAETENVNLVSLTVTVGGDWQTERTTITLDKDGQIIPKP